MNDQASSVKTDRSGQELKVYVVLPAYNEEPNIGKLLDHIDEALHKAALPYQVILVNDGSQDATAEIVGERSTHMPIQIVHHKVNLGLGATIRDGLITASKLAENSDIIVTMDADDTHAPEVISDMVSLIGKGQDIVIASRYQLGSQTVGVPALRRFMSLAASWLFRMLFPIKGVRDYTCGYRAYRAEVIKTALAQYGDNFFDQDGFQCMVDILLKLRKMREMSVAFSEVPFILRYDLKEGATKMKVGRTAVRTLLLILKRRLGR